MIPYSAGKTISKLVISSFPGEMKLGEVLALVESPEAERNQRNPGLHPKEHSQKVKGDSSSPTIYTSGVLKDLELLEQIQSKP